MAGKKVMKKVAQKAAAKTESPAAAKKAPASTKSKKEEVVAQASSSEDAKVSAPASLKLDVKAKEIVVPELDQEELAAESVEEDDSLSEEADEDEKEDQAAIAAALENANKNPNSKNDLSNRIENKKRSNKKATRGVLYVGHLPPGFCENQIRQFFTQFGDVTGCRLCRSKQTGRSKGYGFVEFDLKEIAEIVAQTMDNYLVFNRPLDVKLVPKEKVHATLFKGSGRHMFRRGADNARRARERQNNRVIKGDDGKEKLIRTERQGKRMTGVKEKKKNMLKDFGIEYDLAKLRATVAQEKKQPASPVAVAPAATTKKSPSSAADAKKKTAMKKAKK